MDCLAGLKDGRPALILRPFRGYAGFCLRLAGLPGFARVGQASTACPTFVRGYSFVPTALDCRKSKR